MKKSCMLFMIIVGFASVQASDENISNLTRALRAVSIETELLCNSMQQSPNNRTQSAFYAIKNGDDVNAAEIIADLIYDKKLSNEKVDDMIRVSPVVDPIKFVQAYNLRTRMNSPHCKKFQDALQSNEYCDEQKKEIQKMFDDYLAGVKLTSLRISPWKKNK